MEVGGWGTSRFHSDLCVCGKSSQNSPKPVLIFWSSILSVYTLLTFVGYYDLSVLSIIVMGFQKKSLDGGGWVG